MRTLLSACTAMLFLAGCSGTGSDGEEPTGGLGGSTDATGGASGVSGGTITSGGVGSTGGASGTGGDAIGGAATGGATGGTTPVGGGPVGGAAGGSGGAVTGGSGVGGNSSGGGAATGGSAAAGGTAGGQSTGGAPAGGGDTGGAALGGSATGGASSGGSAAGGADTGGADTGGAATGGSALTEPLLVTSTSGAYWVTGGSLTPVDGGAATVTVDPGSRAQIWEGFGGAFNERGWYYLLMLSQGDRDTALHLLFGAEGCRFAWGRIPIGATDYAMDRYSLDETPNDIALADFSIARDLELLIPYIKAAQAVKPDLRFWASPWSPPTWMKDGPFNDDSAFDGGKIKGDATTLQALAQYFVKFVQGYAEQGIDVELVSPQNEPGYSGTYPTCGWAPEAYASFVGQHLGPALTNAGLDVKIMLGTFNGGTGDSSIISTVMGDATARSFIDVLGYQWGMQGSVSSAQQYNLPVWQTEHKCGNYPWATPFVADIAPNDDAYALESWTLIRDWIRAGVTAYSTWNLVLDEAGIGIDSERVWPQNALMTVDTTSGELTVTPTYYVFRHLSQFVEPGATVIETRGGEALAFANPGGAIVTVMYNSGNATPYTLAAGGRTLQFDMPARGWATVLIPPPDA